MASVAAGFADVVCVGAQVCACGCESTSHISPQCSTKEKETTTDRVLIQEALLVIQQVYQQTQTSIQQLCRMSIRRMLAGVYRPTKCRGVTGWLKWQNVGLKIRRPEVQTRSGAQENNFSESKNVLIRCHTKRANTQSTHIQMINSLCTNITAKVMQNIIQWQC